ncbi:hypothetical protein GQ54DRAFT_256761 [Martensiomyces pterosporus]|nr:hypothetical protein GQ54DRAFT_256761 [Martensiomyces pterosporus]
MDSALEHLDGERKPLDSAYTNAGNNPKLSDAEKTHVIERLNTFYSRDILNIARYYGDCPSAKSARVCNLDVDMVTVEWSWIDKNGTPHVRSMQFDISKTQGPATTMKGVMDMSSNARQALLAQREAQQAASSAPKEPIKFKLPPLPLIAATLGGFAVLAFLAFTSTDSLLARWVFWILPQTFYYVVLVSLAVIHCLEAVIMFLACRRYQRHYPGVLGSSTQLKYTVSTLVFGVFSAVQFTRQAFTHSDYSIALEVSVEPNGIDDADAQQ